MISASTPLEGAGISASTLSVEISKIGSSRFTESPTFFSHLESVPSAMDSPICGITTSTRATDPPFANRPCSTVLPAALQPVDRYAGQQHRPDERPCIEVLPPVADRRPIRRLTADDT